MFTQEQYLEAYNDLNVEDMSKEAWDRMTGFHVEIIVAALKQAAGV